MNAPAIYTGRVLPRVYWFVIFMGLIFSLIGGCKVEDKTWIDKMLSDVGLALAEADKAGLGQEGRDIAMVKVVQKYFPTGMRKEDAFVLLHEMKNSGFDVTENRHEGARKWSSGEFRPYVDEATRRSFQIQNPPGASKVIAVRTWRSRLVVEEFFAISITIPDNTGLISRVSVNRSASFL